MELQSEAFELSRAALRMGQEARTLQEWLSAFDLVPRAVPEPIPLRANEPKIVAFPSTRRALARVR
jgi:hypothetical protein